MSSNAGRDMVPHHLWWYSFFIRVPVRCFILPLGRIFIPLKIERYKGELKDPCIIFYNHSTDFDFAGVIDGIPKYGRHVMSDELLKKKWKRTIIMTATDGIYRRKGERADEVIAAIKATLDQGINVYMVVEGEETHNGVTQPVRKRTGQMVKDLGCDIVTFRLEGGYLMKPKWSEEKSKTGPLFGAVQHVYKKEELAKLTPEEINDLIYKDLYLNVFDWNREHQVPYDRKCRAEFLERILYICPKCHSECKMQSKVHDFFCPDCGYKVSMNRYGLFEGDDMVFDNIYDWDVWQKEEMRKKRPEWEANPDAVITSDSGCVLKKLNGDDQEVLDENITVKITFNDLIIEGEKFNQRFPLRELEGLASIRKGIGFTYDGVYYKAITPNKACMLRYRTIRRIIMNESYI